MKRYLIILGLFVICILNAETVTLEKAIQIGLENNFDIKMSESDLNASKANKYKAFSALIPSVTGSTNLQKMYNNQTEDWDDGKTIGLQVNQPIFQGGKIVYGIKLANNSLELNKVSNEQSIKNTISKIEKFFYDYLSAKSALEIAIKDLENITEQYEKADVKFKAGVISEIDLLQFKVQKSQKESNKLSMENKLDIALENFQNAIGNRNLIPSEIVLKDVYQNALEFGNLDNNEMTLFIQSAMNILKKDNLDLKKNKIQIQNAKSQLRMSQFGFLPSISLYYNHNWSGTDYSSLNDTKSMGLSFSKNLSLGIEYFTMKENAFKLKKAQYSQKSLEQSLELNLKNQIYNLVTSAKNLETLSLTVEQSEKLYRKMVLKYEKNAISAMDLLDSFIKLYNAKYQFNDGIYRFLEAKTELQHTLNLNEDFTLDRFLN